MIGHVVSPGAISFLANHEQQSEVSGAIGKQGFGGFDHGGDDAFDVAGTAAPDEFLIFRRWKKWRDGIEMGGERHQGLAPACENVEAVGLNLNQFHRAVCSDG